VKQGPDGALYLMVTMKKGRLLRLTPAAKQAAVPVSSFRAKRR